MGVAISDPHSSIAGVLDVTTTAAIRRKQGQTSEYWYLQGSISIVPCGRIVAVPHGGKMSVHNLM